MDEPLLTVKEVAERLKIKETTVRSKIRKKELRAIDVGGEYRVMESDLAEFVRRNETKPPEDEAA